MEGQHYLTGKEKIRTRGIAELKPREKSFERSHFLSHDNWGGGGITQENKTEERKK